MSAHGSESGDYDYDSCNEYVPGAGAPNQHQNWGSQECSPMPMPMPMPVRQMQPNYGNLGMGSGSNNSSPRSGPAFRAHPSSGSGEFVLPSPVLPTASPMGFQQAHGSPHFPPQFQGQMMPGVPPEVIEAIRKEATEHAEHKLSAIKAECDRQVHLARVRIAELEESKRRADAEGDEMIAQLTALELAKAEVEARLAACPQADPPATPAASEKSRVQELEAELAASKQTNVELERMKKIVMTLSRELKKRMGGGSGEAEIRDVGEGSELDEDLEWECSMDSKGHIAFMRKQSTDSSYTAADDSDYMLTPPPDEE